MALDPETKKEVDALSARILSLSEELAAVKKSPNPSDAVIQALQGEISGLRKDLDAVKAGAPPPAPAPDPDPDPPDIPTVGGVGCAGLFDPRLYE